ncbi:MAG: NnrS family protein [Pseudomonadota bacterium]|nr:NnrS family protein [Pseudomonadota bacterium]
MLLPMQIRMVAMLHAAFTWPAASFVLAGLAHWQDPAPDGNWHAAPLHAFTMGFLDATLLAMLTRFVCAQTGRAVVADDLLWRLFWMLQVAAALRLAASTAAQFITPWQWPLTAGGAAVWSLLWFTWAGRYVPWLARPRQDGRPG